MKNTKKAFEIRSGQVVFFRLGGAEPFALRSLRLVRYLVLSVRRTSTGRILLDLRNRASGQRRQKTLRDAEDVRVEL